MSEYSVAAGLVSENAFGTSTNNLDDATILGACQKHLAICEARQAPRTFINEKLYVGHIIDYFGEKKPIDSIRDVDIAGLIRSFKTRQNMGARVLRCLRSILETYVESGHLSKNPAKGIRPPRQDAPKVYYLSQDQMRAIIEEARKRSEQTPPRVKELTAFLWAFVAISLTTGSRPQETMNMKLSDFDRKTMTINVLSPKTGKRRVLGLSKIVLDAVDFVSAWLKETLEDSKVMVTEATRIQDRADAVNRVKAMKEAIASGYVFPSIRGGERVGGVNFRKQWHSLLSSLDIPYQPMYTMRHSFAVHSMLGGVPANVVQTLMGHTDLSMTTRYTAVADEATHAGSAAISAALGYDGGSEKQIKSSRTRVKKVNAGDD